jgi:hypothetical protein
VSYEELGRCLAVMARCGKDLRELPEHDDRTTISGEHLAVDDPVLERLRSDTEPVLSSDRDARDTDRCPPWFEVVS